MQWTVRLEARTSAGEVQTTELVTFSRPGVVSALLTARCTPELERVQAELGARTSFRDVRADRAIGVKLTG